jgi:hypothetical protein
MFMFICEFVRAGLVAGLAVMNLAHVRWQLSNFTVCSFSLEAVYMPLLWAALDLAVYLFNTCSTYFHVSLSPPNRTIDWRKTEFQLSANLPKTELAMFRLPFLRRISNSGSVNIRSICRAIFSNLNLDLLSLPT